MKDTELTAIEQRYQATTPGPWTAYIEGRDHDSGSDFIMRGPPERRAGDLELSNASSADFEFIAHARQDIPNLIAEIKRLQALLDDKIPQHRILEFDSIQTLS